MAGFLVYDLVVSWKAYKCFKEEYARQVMGGASGDGYQLFTGQGIRGMSRFDDPE